MLKQLFSICSHVLIIQRMLTSRQRKTLSVICSYIRRNGFSPSFSEIAQGLGIKSRGVVHRYVHALENAGYINLIPGRQRNIQLIEETKTNTLPMLGQIAAGQPIEAIEEINSIDPSEELYGENRYALKIKGESMIDIGIHNGDIVIIENQQTAHNGDIVVALVDNTEATLKRFRKLDNDQVELMPENPTMESMVYHQSQVSIQGVLVGQFRTYT